MTNGPKHGQTYSPAMRALDPYPHREKNSLFPDCNPKLPAFDNLTA